MKNGKTPVLAKEEARALLDDRMRLKENGSNTLRVKVASEQVSARYRGGCTRGRRGGRARRSITDHFCLGIDELLR